MAIRVIQWATGNLGRAAVEAIVSHPELELAGAWVHSAEKAGRDVGEICGIGSLGVTASDDADEVLAIDADCVLYAPIVGRKKEAIRILESGKNVVTPLNWFYPKSLDVADLEATCRKYAVTLHGTGIHPGGITERFPLMISALSRAITHVRAEEFSDIRTYGAPAVIADVMLFGKTPDEARKSPMLNVLGGGFQQSLDMVADVLGVVLDPEKRATHEMAVATAPIESPIGVIEPGKVAAQRFTWEGFVKGKPFVMARVNWLMGQQHLEPDWSLGDPGERGDRHGRFEIEITGDPSVKVTFHGLHPESIEEGLRRNSGIVATATHCVSAIPATCAADPGIRTYLDLPLVAGRAAPELIRAAS
ncbi:MAG: dihydrodipicolinate reductase [Myxococcales bacterium]|nr:dihydrodipicolinate reductase [Myxococcales bacterium]